MTDTSDSLTVSGKTLRWLEVAALMAAFLGPPLAVYTSYRIMEYRIQALEIQAAKQGDALVRLAESVDAKLDRINDKLGRVESSISNIEGRSGRP